MGYFTTKHIEQIRFKPHLLGLMAGKDKLTDLHSEMILHCLDTNEHRRLQAHRGSYKTTSVDIVGSVWWMLFHPNDRIAIVRKTHTDACECIVNISQIMQMEIIRELFKYMHGFYPEAKTNRADKLVYNFKETTTPEGNVNAYSIKTSLTGKHFDKPILDDFVTIEDRISQAEREKTKLMLEEIINNVLDPGKPAAFIGTPWHKRDAWEKCPKPVVYDCYSTGILTEEQIEEKKSSMTRPTFCANYELRHTNSDSSLFQNAKFERWDFRVKENIYGHLDAKFSGTHTNGLTFLGKRRDGRIQGVGFCFPENIKYKYDYVKEKWKKYFCGSFYMEDNADKGFVADELKKLGMPVYSYHENMNKHVKIDKFLGKFWDKIVWDPATDTEYINQLLDYEEGCEPDDCPDSAASLLRKKFDDSWRALYS